MIVIGGLLLVVGLMLGLLIGRGNNETSSNTTEQLPVETAATPGSSPKTESPTGAEVTTIQAAEATPPEATEVTTAAAPTTAAAAAAEPVLTQAELAGCAADVSVMPEGSIADHVFSFDFDGIDGDEVVFTYYNPVDETWVLRVEAEDGSLSSEIELPTSSAIGARVITVIDSNADGDPELVVKIDGGAYSEVMAFAVMRNCDAELTRNLEGQVFTWPVGASVGSISGFECVNTYIRFRAGSLTDAMVWSYHTYSNALNGIVWEPIGTAGSTYSGETDDDTPPFAAEVDCAPVPFDPDA